MQMKSLARLWKAIVGEAIHVNLIKDIWEKI